MNKDQTIGGLILVGSIAGIIIYAWLLFLVGAEVSMLVLKLTGLIAVGGVLGILAWIGYTLATTPPPAPIEDIEKELEKDLHTVTESASSTSEAKTGVEQKT
ncbi:MAG: transcriptional regulator [Candidatus Bathyarchaeia archaeon]